MNETELKALLSRYQIDAMRTSLKTEPRMDLLIRACGLAGEWGEYQAALYADRADWLEHRDEELGDVFWYIAAVADIKGLKLSELTISDRAVPLRSCAEYVGAVCEYAKKTAGHGRDKPIEDLITPLSMLLSKCVITASYDLPSILAANVAKLRARHANAGPGGFDPGYGVPKPTAPAPTFSIPSYDANGSPVADSRDQALSPWSEG